MNQGRLPEASDKNLIKALHLLETEQLSKDPVFRKVLDAIEDRLIFHRDMLIRSKRRYSWGNMALALAIPVLSATLTWATTANFEDPNHFVGMLGLFLTILTILNSVFRPTERYLTASHMLVRLHDWEIDLVTNLQDIQTQQINEIYEFLKKKDHQLSELGADMVVRLFQKDAGPQKGDATQSVTDKT